MRHEIVTHRAGFHSGDLNKFRVLIAEGGGDDGLVLVEQPDGRFTVPDSDGIPQYVKPDDCTFRQVGGDFTSFADAATVLLFIQERETLIRLSCWLAQERRHTMTVEWFGTDVAHALSAGGFIRVEDLRPGAFVHSPPVSAGDRLL